MKYKIQKSTKYKIKIQKIQNICKPSPHQAAHLATFHLTKDFLPSLPEGNNQHQTQGITCFHHKPEKEWVMENWNWKWWQFDSTASATHYTGLLSYQTNTKSNLERSSNGQIIYKFCTISVILSSSYENFLPFWAYIWLFWPNLWFRIFDPLVKWNGLGGAVILIPSPKLWIPMRHNF